MDADAVRKILADGPTIDEGAWVAPGAVVAGRVSVADGASIWYGCVLRGDGDSISIGKQTNIQDGTVVHVDEGFPCVIGDRVTVGHRAIIHGARIDDGALIGMGAIVMNGCHIGEQALVAAGALLKEGTVVGPRTLWAGVPARKVRDLNDEAVEKLEAGWRHYTVAGSLYREQFGSGSDIS